MTSGQIAQKRGSAYRAGSHRRSLATPSTKTNARPTIKGSARSGEPAEDARQQCGGQHHIISFHRLVAGLDWCRLIPLLVAGAPVIFAYWLFQHRPHEASLGSATSIIGNAVSVTLVVLVLAVEGVQLLASTALFWSVCVARDPVPIVVKPTFRVAFTTTVVPSAEPLDMVRATLLAARRIRYSGNFDVWLLDEGDDPQVRQMCRDIGVHHFSRRGTGTWNQSRGAFRRKTKHGNHNAWLAAHGDAYDVVLSVDPDHVPRPDFAERMLGYFRDPDTAFVIAPQVYGNLDNLVTRGAEAQNSLFQAAIQRAGNRLGCSMLVGTNNAYRVSAWRQIGGFQDSITEDLATSLTVHGARNPLTGGRWRSVYTANVVAVGEGPTSWTDCFNQQLRWSRGACELLVAGGLRGLLALSSARRTYYLFLMSHYPLTAVRWLLGMVLVAYTAVVGSDKITSAPWYLWLAFYSVCFIARTLPYFVLRKYSVSVGAKQVKSGLAGILLSLLCTPLYSAALVGTLLRRPFGFVVTRKGENVTSDGLSTFRRHIFWGIFIAISGGVSMMIERGAPNNLGWTVPPLAICLLPVLFWKVRGASPGTTTVRTVPTTSRLQLYSGVD